MRRVNNFVFLILSFLICLNILAWIAVYDLSKPQLLEVNFFDVGQGDAIFIKTPQRHQILIDGGPDSTILEKLGKEMPFWDRTIDLITLSHPERDHLVGLIEILKRYKIENILWTGVVRDTAEYEEWQGAIEKEGAKIFIAQAGQKIKLHGSDPCNLQHPCIFMEVLYPSENLEGQEFKNSNNTSIIAKLVFKTTPAHQPRGPLGGRREDRSPASRAPNSFLFTGDAYKSVEHKLINQNLYLDSNILKVGHHGSKTSTSEEFLKQVSPEIAVFQVGKDNLYGHPHLETLERLEKFDITILRTDLDGDIKIISDSKNYHIITNK